MLVQQYGNTPIKSYSKEIDLMRGVILKRHKNFSKEYLLFIERYLIHVNTCLIRKLFANSIIKTQEQTVRVEWETRMILDQGVEENTKRTKSEFMSPAGIYLLKISNENTRTMCQAVQS